MNTSLSNTINPSVDLSQFSEQELKEALNQIENKKNGERDAYKNWLPKLSQKLFQDYTKPPK